MNKRAMILFVLSAAVLTRQWASASAKPEVTWAPVIPEQLFPAAILATGSVSAKPGTGPLCDPRSSFRVRVKSSSPGTRMHVEVMVDGFFSAVSSCDAVLKNARQQYMMAPTPRWDMHKLAFNDEPYPATVVLSVKANGVDLGQKTLRLQIRAVNDVPTGWLDSKGSFHDQSKLYAAFVNENSPVVDKLLHEALQWRAVSQFYGYNGGRASKQDVQMQVFAIWNALQHRDVKFSSITRPSGFSTNIRSQSVRFVGQSVAMSEANCVDGSVLFASVLYKIGILPILVIKPGHMFVGYYLVPATGTDVSDSQKANLTFLETTRLGLGQRPENQPFQDHPAVISSKSYEEFVAATKRGDEEFWTDVEPNWRKGKLEYSVLNIATLRKNGINPIPR
jgi:hypothetical protein